ncbi:MAG: DUF924 domain-containing protein [Candidatus Thiodiazotropha sp. (ex Codakia rugifera)]|nr:DUF924 domain-containing protein [Candidatus Thiodiazotropha sp. (ex Codakia rugifera)]
MTAIYPHQIIEFWFSKRVAPLRFNSTPAFDQEVSDNYLPLWQNAENGQLDHWLETKEGCLALVIVLDQFPLHMFRNQAESFSTEQQSRDVAEHAIACGFDAQLPLDQKAFLYLPFMHSESLSDQERSVSLFESAGLNDNLKWAKHHRDLIQRFGRFPHRNTLLGRESSTEELTYLSSKEAFIG